MGHPQAGRRPLVVVEGRRELVDQSDAVSGRTSKERYYTRRRYRCTPTAGS